jgi:hypothetical protein
LGKWTIGGRAIGDQIDRAKLRFIVTRTLTSSLQVGLEWNPLAEKVSPLANWRALSETDARPAIILGTSSDRIGTPSGQSFYVTVSKDVSPWLRLPLAPYVGVAYGTYEDEARAIAGLNVYFPAGFTSLVIYDGVKVHPTVSWSRDRHTFSFVLAHAEDPGISYSVVF